MAILGLRALYFCLAGMADKFRYLNTGLGVILGYHLLRYAANPYVAKLSAEIALQERGGLFQTTTKITLSHPKEPTPWIEL